MIHTFTRYSVELQRRGVTMGSIQYHISKAGEYRATALREKAEGFIWWVFALQSAKDHLLMARALRAG
jgi:hypothetical protein